MIINFSFAKEKFNHMANQKGSPVQVESTIPPCKRKAITKKKTMRYFENEA